MSGGTIASDRPSEQKESMDLQGDLTGATRVMAVFGYPVHHSLSPAMHNAAFRALGLDCVYVAFNVHPGDLEAAVRGILALGLVGVNVTIPHKESVIEFLEEVNADAARIRSVNTIWNRGGHLVGSSTDGPGFIRALESAGKSPDGSRAVVVGAGGAARATAYALAERGASITVVNRTYERAVYLAELLNSAFGRKVIVPVGLGSPEAREAIEEADLLVNCTSVGMYPDIDAQPIPTEWLHSRLFVYDQIYNPEETKLLRAAREIGARGVNGLGMLVYQGAISFEVWTGMSAPVEVMEDAVRRVIGRASAT